MVINNIFAPVKAVVRHFPLVPQRFQNFLCLLSSKENYSSQIQIPKSIQSSMYKCCFVLSPKRKRKIKHPKKWPQLITMMDPVEEGTSLLDLNGHSTRILI
jgi:hypothetical protein